MTHRSLLAFPLTVLSVVAFAQSSQANSTHYADTYCEYYPTGERQPQVAMPCTMVYHSGKNDIDIRWQDGVTSYFRAVGNHRGAMHIDFVDRQGNQVTAFYAQGCDLGISIPSGTVYVADAAYCE